MKTIPLSNFSKSFIVDDGDYLECTYHSWNLDSHGYPRATINGTATYVHKFLLKTPKGFHTDHINGDKLDNRRSNLRICTQAENMRNRKCSTNNKSGYKGVSWKIPNNKYRATIHSGNRTIHLGYFDSPIDAAKAYDVAAIQYFGKFSKLNF